MSIYGKAAQFLGKAKASGGFGFVPKAKEAAKKMYGFGRENPGQAAGMGAVALGLGAIGSTLPDYSEMGEVADRYKLNKYLKNDHNKWLKSEFNGEKDIMHMRDISAKLISKFRAESSSEEEVMEKFRPAYEGFLIEASKRKGSPSAEELHRIMGMMRGK